MDALLKQQVKGIPVGIFGDQALYFRESIVFCGLKLSGRIKKMCH
jgi:hypothetical protein